MDDELIEDEDLVIPGETLFGDSSATDSDGDQDDVPVRLLQDFTIYDMSTNEAVPVGELLTLKYVHKTYGASGIVKPWTDNENGEEDADSEDSISTLDLSQRVKLSKLLEFDVHYYSDMSKSLDRYVSPSALCIKHSGRLLIPNYLYLHAAKSTSVPPLRGTF